MLRSRFGFACLGLALLATTGATSRRSAAPLVTTREIIAVYLGTEGTDARSGMVDVVRDMKSALKQQAASSGRTFVSRGVSLAPSVEGGIRHLALFGPFDEVSLGGNWTNSAVVRYLGGDMSNQQRAAIPQVIVLERDVQRDGGSMLLVGPEREIARYIGGNKIADWVRSGTPLPR